MSNIFHFVVPKFYEWGRKNATKVVVVFFALILFDVGVFTRIVGGVSAEGIYFLNVGQGDAELVVFSDGVKFLIDGGPVQGNVHGIMGDILPPEERYIDLVMMSHPQIDHYGGLPDVLRRYRVGAFLSNGETSDSDSFAALRDELDINNVPQFVLRAGDVIRHRNDSFVVLSPVVTGEGSAANDDALVGVLSFSGAKIFFAADSDKNVEKEVLSRWSAPVDVLKVAHHGSQYGSTAAFLGTTHPKIAIIEVGKNSYGHPAPETLARLADSGARIFRTDQDGTILATFESGTIKIFSFE